MQSLAAADDGECASAIRTLSVVHDSGRAERVGGGGAGDGDLIVFASVVVGPDGTVFALAVEPETGDKSSATILGIAADSTVRWHTTVLEP